MACYHNMHPAWVSWTSPVLRTEMSRTRMPGEVAYLPARPEADAFYSPGEVAYLPVPVRFGLGAIGDEGQQWRAPPRGGACAAAPSCDGGSTCCPGGETDTDTEAGAKASGHFGGELEGDFVPLYDEGEEYKGEYLCMHELYDGTAFGATPVQRYSYFHFEVYGHRPDLDCTTGWHDIQHITELFKDTKGFVILENKMSRLHMGDLVPYKQVKAAYAQKDQPNSFMNFMKVSFRLA
ncbi:unnamed protein product [Prorocentrum cordatum]|uniref:Transmembrane 9 superfamily member n=1 Tax=Prorocentrum cordatum TaxID=2364126 RepID=A0ABN9TJ62_9DINO|nr:unnamed protein product [Polarella glacialis]